MDAFPTRGTESQRCSINAILVRISSIYFLSIESLDRVELKATLAISVALSATQLLALLSSNLVFSALRNALLLTYRHFPQ